MVKYQSELHGFFAEFMQDQDISRLFQVIDSVDSRASDTILETGKEADGIYFVVSGRVAVQKQTGFGVRKQVVALLDKGAPVGEGGLLRGVVRAATVVAVEDSSLLYLSRNSFDQLCEGRPDFGYIFFRWILERVSMRLQSSTERLAHIL
ncbi:MAG: CRP/FNR family cyclic AMP-dependent transcriptional regulator [Desulforhopalus sp.]|jgi:CRP/FNR family cyclic AMP-dependent transcriptional regulator